MSIRRWLLSGVVALTLSACVPTSDFEEYKARIKADGDALDAWVTATHEWVRWLNQNASTICPNCGPPPMPPDPPPDGDWE